MASTKEKILIAALKLFNRDGIVNVRLQHIADEAFVSVGNLAYHFPNKEAIVLAIYQSLTSKQKEVLTEYRVVPLFDNIDRLVQHTYSVQQEYVFFYLDTLEIMRAYPSIQKEHQLHITSQVSQLKVILDFNVARGSLIPEPIEEAYDGLARQIWMTMDFWLTQHAVQFTTPPLPQKYRRAIWNLFIPYFTEMGKREYGQMLQMPYDFYF